MKAILTFLILLALITSFTNCKKKYTTEELIYGRWLARTAYCKKTDASTGTDIIKDTTIYFSKGEYCNFLKDNVFIIHRGSDIYDTSKYLIEGNKLTIISAKTTGGNALPDTSHFDIVTLTEFNVEMREIKYPSATLKIDSTLNLGR